MTQAGFTGVSVKSAGPVDEMRIYTVDYVLSEYGTQIAVEPTSWPVHFPKKENVDLKHIGPVGTCLIDEIVRNTKGVAFIMVDLHSLIIMRHTDYGWTEIEPKILKAIEKALMVDSRLWGKQLP